MMIRLVQTFFGRLSSSAILDAIEAGNAAIVSVELRRDEAVDVDALHDELQVWQMLEFGREDPRDAMTMYEGEAEGCYRHRLGMIPGARVASHYHLRGNNETWTLAEDSGDVTVLWGDELQHRRRYSAGEAFTVDGSQLHAFMAHDREVKGYLFIEKKV